jgi:hypothetical protein
LSEKQSAFNQNTFWKMKNKVKEPFIIGMYITEHNNFVLIGIQCMCSYVYESSFQKGTGAGGDVIW